ncbi:MAG TPA: FAD-dependent thymidylate synthase [Actinomycetota bacterium]|nr:FAD-dependent thymidylate synthase [Actinomycetota bacterium]
MTEEIRPGDKPGELLVFDHGFVRLDEAMADDLSVVNGARVSFAAHRDEMDERDAGLIKFLMRSGHGSPFEHNSFRFHIRCPIFVAREWFRHRVGCLTGDTRISFVDVTGAAPRGLSKSMDELWAMWTVGEKNGGALTRSREEDISRLISAGHSLRAAARMTGSGRNTITRYLSEGTTAYRSSRWRLRGMRVRVLDEDSNEFTTAHISEMFESGVQLVYRVTLADGKQIDATRTHRFLTDAGWQTLEEAVGLTGHGVEARTTRLASFVINGAKAYQDRVWMEQRRERGRSVQEMADDAGCSYHTIRKWLGKHGLQFSQHERGYRPGHVPWNDGVKGYKLVRRWSPEQLEAIRKARSGPKSNFWRGGVSSERASIARWTTEQAPLVHFRYDYTCQVRSCLKRGGKLHAHHIVPVWLDESRARDIGNLITVCDACHRSIHRTQDAEIAFARDYAAFQGAVTESLQIPHRRGCKLTGRPVQVERVEYVGLRQTYDLSVEVPWHNFVANGIVVHNSFNEESARYHQLEGDFYVPSPQAVRTQVGKPGAYTFEPAEETVATDTIDTFRRVYGQLYDEYLALVGKGVAKELARSLLPFGIYTQFYWTLNARSLMNFLALRNSPSAQYEIRIYAQAVEQLFAGKMPVTHACFEEFGRNVP